MIRIDREQIGRLTHESWSRTMRAHGVHGPEDKCKSYGYPCNTGRHCSYFHADLIPWDRLPENKKAINRAAVDAVLPYFERLLMQMAAQPPAGVVSSTPAPGEPAKK